MSFNSNKLFRLQILISMMRKHQYPNFIRFFRAMQREDPAGTFKLSSRTFNRDIALLRNEYQAPVCYDNAQRGFYLADNDWFNENLMVAPAELNDSLKSSFLPQILMPLPLLELLPEAVERVLKGDSDDIAGFFSPEVLKQLNASGLIASPEIMGELINAIKLHRILLLCYQDCNKPTEFILFAPQCIAWFGGVWFVKGFRFPQTPFDLSHPRLTVLAVYRIQKVSLRGEHIPDAQRHPNLASSQRLFDYRMLAHAQLEYSSTFSSIAKEHFLHVSGSSVEERPNGNLVVTLTNITMFDFINIALCGQGLATVIAPSEAVDSYQEAVLRLAQSIGITPREAASTDRAEAN